MQTGRPLVIAHRGDSAHAPENTVAAFDAALKSGCDGIELDLRLTADGVAVVCHDASLARFGGGGRLICQSGAAQLAGAEVGGWFARRFRGERVPTLDEVLERYGRRTRLLLEIKQASGMSGTRRTRRLVEATVAAIARHRVGERVLVLCFSAPALAMVRRLAPALRCVLNCERAPRDLQRLARAGFHAIDLDQRRVGARVVERCHAVGLRCFSYTCNDEATLRRLLAAGVDGIISNRPGWLRTRLARER